MKVRKVIIVAAIAACVVGAQPQLRAQDYASNTPAPAYQKAEVLSWAAIIAAFAAAVLAQLAEAAKNSQGVH